MKIDISKEENDPCWEAFFQGIESPCEKMIQKNNFEKIMKKIKYRDPDKEKISYKLSACNKYQCRRKYAEIPEHMLWEDPSVVFDHEMVEKEVMKYKEDYRKEVENKRPQYEKNDEKNYIITPLW